MLASITITSVLDQHAGFPHCNLSWKVYTDKLLHSDTIPNRSFYFIMLGT